MNEPQEVSSEAFDVAYAEFIKHLPNGEFTMARAVASKYIKPRVVHTDVQETSVKEVITENYDEAYEEFINNLSVEKRKNEINK